MSVVNNVNQSSFSKFFASESELFLHHFISNRNVNFDPDVFKNPMSFF